MDALKISVQKLENLRELPLPSYATKNSAGMDLMAAIDAPIVVAAGAIALVPTGIAISLPEGFEAQIRPRSGLAFKHGISIPNSPGTIDSDYRGEIKVILINLGQTDFVIERGMRIAQMVIAKHEVASWNIVDSLDDTDRSSGGFGSTGIQSAA